MAPINISHTGSLVNAIYRQTASPEPEEGMGATILLYTDRHAATIVFVSRDKRLVYVARDRAIRVDDHGRSESQTYRYEPGDPTQTECFTLRKNGRWVRRGQQQNSGTSLFIGKRQEYYDYSF